MIVAETNDYIGKGLVAASIAILLLIVSCIDCSLSQTALR